MSLSHDFMNRNFIPIPPEQPLEQSNFLFLTHILYEFGLLVEVLGELENNRIGALFVGFRISLHLLDDLVGALASFR